MDMISAPQFGEILEQGQQTVKQSAKRSLSNVSASVKNQVGLNRNGQTTSSPNAGLADTVAAQIGFRNKAGVTQYSQTQAQDQTGAQVSGEKTQSVGSEETAEMVKDYYSPSDTVSQTQTIQAQEEEETKQKILKVRQALHDEVYYNPLLAFEHRKTEHLKEEEENLEEQKMTELQKEEKKKLPPLAVQRAQTTIEVNRGISG